jgi:hypothetical protein
MADQTSEWAYGDTRIDAKLNMFVWSGVQPIEKTEKELHDLTPAK